MRMLKWAFERNRNSQQRTAPMTPNQLIQSRVISNSFVVVVAFFRVFNTWHTFHTCHRVTAAAAAAIEM